MNTCRTSSRFCRVTLLIALALTLPGLAAADELLSVGIWKGGYKPKDIGEPVDATFKVERNSLNAPWKVTMHLKLDPPGNVPIPFDNIQTNDDALEFSISIQGVQRICVLHESAEDELSGECMLEGESLRGNATLTMRRPPAESIE
jgi:hypothetical protein